jgi:hypothetical protein
MSAPDPFALGGDGDDTEAVAAIEFEPIDNAGIIAALSEPEWSRSMMWLGIYLRVAAHTIDKSKVELGNIARNLDKEDVLLDTLDNLDEAQKKLEGLAKLAKAAIARLLVAGSAAAAEDETAEGAT